MAFFEITITGTKQFFVEAGEASAQLHNDAPDIDECNRHNIKVFDRAGIEY